MDRSASSGAAPSEVDATPELQGDALHARIDELHRSQQQFFAAGRTLPQSAREDALRALLHAFETKEKLVLDALHADLHKSTTEAYFTEVGYVTAEIKHHLGLAASHKGMALVETDHYTLEQKHWPKLASILGEHYKDLKTKVSERGPALWRRP